MKILIDGVSIALFLAALVSGFSGAYDYVAGGKGGDNPAKATRDVCFGIFLLVLAFMIRNW